MGADDEVAKRELTSRKGPVVATVRIDPEKLVIGDAVTLMLTVTAEKGVELIMPEFGRVLERFAIIDFTTKQRIDDEGRTTATQTYVLQPPRSGRQRIPSIMVEFVDRRDGAQAAPEDLDAWELLTEPIAFEVASALPQEIKATLHPEADELPLIDRTGGARWPWWIAAAVVVVAAPLLWRYWSASRSRARRHSAYELAMNRLDRLLARPRAEPEQVDEFFVELSAIVRWYLETRFELRAPELTTEEFLSLVSSSSELNPSVVGDYRLLLRDFLNRADLVKFANFRPAERDIEESVAAARRFLNETRRDAPMVDMRAWRAGAEGTGRASTGGAHG